MSFCVNSYFFRSYYYYQLYHFHVSVHVCSSFCLHKLDARQPNSIVIFVCRKSKR
jgi:hypothetical protein